VANLIITIISIALIAVAAIMGVYYGGTAYQAASAKAKAVALVEAASQTAAAWRVYALERGGNTLIPSIPSSHTALCSDMFAPLIPAHLASRPAVPRLGTTPSQCLTPYYDSVGEYSNVSGTGNPCCGTGWQHYATSNQTGLLMLWWGDDAEVCREIVRMARGPTAVMGSSGSGAWAPSGTPAGGATFDCYHWQHPDAFAFYYKVWN